MRKVVLIVALLPGIAIAAEQQKKPAPTPATASPCARYGDGWVQVKGTDTCVKLSGSIQVDIGARR